MERQVYISQGDLSAKITLPLVLECADAYENLARTKEVLLMGVPGHYLIKYKKAAYELARNGDKQIHAMARSLI